MESTGLFLTLGILFVLWLVAVGLSTGARSARIAAHHHASSHSIPPVSQSAEGSSAQCGLATGVRDHLGKLFGPLSGYLERIRKTHGKEKPGGTRRS